jgi:hypothetical protein
MAAAQWQQREAAADSPAPSANAPTHTTSNATNAPMYASLSLVKDGGTTAPTASLPLTAMAAPVETSTVVANAPPPPTMKPQMMTLPTPMPTATAMTSFV